MTDPLHCIVELESGPCPAQPVAVEGDGVPRCLTHATDALRIRRRTARNAAGGENRLRTLAKATPPPRFRTPEQIERYAERTAHRVQTGQLDRRVAETCLRAATVALQVHQLKNQERLTDALMRAEHGGMAVQMLAVLTSGLADGKRRPLPGRVQALPVSPEQAS